MVWCVAAWNDHERIPRLTVDKGATTFRLCYNGLILFLDTWFDKPSVLPSYLSVDDITEADYIFISHAHFDQSVIEQPMSSFVPMLTSHLKPSWSRSHCDQDRGNSHSQ